MDKQSPQHHESPSHRRETLTTSDFHIVESSSGVHHSFDQDEVDRFSSIINNTFQEDLYLKSFLPLKIGSQDIFSAVEDGVLMCKLVNSAGNGDTIDESKINKKSNMNIFQKTENINKAISGAKKLGCILVNMTPQLIFEKREHIILGFIWQLMRIKYLSHINLKQVPNLSSLKEASETEENFLKLNPENLLLRWFNYHLRRKKVVKKISNFSFDLKDAVAYTYLLFQLDSSKCDKLGLDYELYQRAEQVVINAKKLGVVNPITAGDIIGGNSKLNLLFCAQIFIISPGLKSLEEIMKDEEEEKNFIIMENFKKKEESDEKKLNNLENSNQKEELEDKKLIKLKDLNNEDENKEKNFMDSENFECLVKENLIEEKDINESEKNNENVFEIKEMDTMIVSNENTEGKINEMFNILKNSEILVEETQEKTSHKEEKPKKSSKNEEKNFEGLEKEKIIEEKDFNISEKNKENREMDTIIISNDDKKEYQEKIIEKLENSEILIKDTGEKTNKEEKIEKSSKSTEEMSTNIKQENEAKQSTYEESTLTKYPKIPIINYDKKMAEIENEINKIKGFCWWCILLKFILVLAFIINGYDHISRNNDYVHALNKRYQIFEQAMQKIGIIIPNFIHQNVKFAIPMVNSFVAIESLLAVILILYLSEYIGQLLGFHLVLVLVFYGGCISNNVFKGIWESDLELDGLVVNIIGCGFGMLLWNRVCWVCKSKPHQK